jgi:hypothetical protein
MPDWPRLMNEADAAAYLSIGTTKLRAEGPRPKTWGGRTLWDRRDLDRFADALGAGSVALDEQDAAAQSKDVERQFIERRKKKGTDNGRTTAGT